MAGKLENLYYAILAGQREVAKDNVTQALADGVAPRDPGCDGQRDGEVGGLFEEGEYFVPELLIAARAMKTGMENLKPERIDADIWPAGKIVAGTVKGDRHDIGKNRVCMMLEGAGFQGVD